MKDFNFVPMFHPGLNELTDGIGIKASDYCKKNCISNPKCQQHYQQIFTREDGNYMCHAGFISTVFSDSEHEKYIFTGMRLKDFYNPKLADPKIKSCVSKNSSKDSCSGNKRITSQELATYIEYYLEYKHGVESHDSLKNFVEDIFHDIRTFNGQLKHKNDRLYKKASSGSKGSGQFLELSRNMAAICSYMTLRLNAYDFTYNEELLTATGQSSYNIYRIFDKVKHCLSDKAEERHVKISICCNGECGDIKAYDSLELLPYILLDNAVKYSDCKSHIKVDILDSPEKCCFSVTSQSPRLKEGEQEKIFRRGFRGENARHLTEEGLGIGLYTAKKICEIHNGSISVRESYNSRENANNFVVDITLKKNYNI